MFVMEELPTLPSVILMKIGIVRFLDQKVDTYFFLKPLGDAQESDMVANFLFFNEGRGGLSI
jgi:hypothetical protein